MKPLLKTIDAISEWVGKVVCYLIVAVMFILVYETVARYGFNSPTTWAHHISWNLTGPFFVLGGAYALVKKAHVNMDVVYNRFPIRMRAIVDLFTAMLFYFFCGVLFWKGLQWGWGSLMGSETSGPPLYFPIYPIKLTVPIGAFLILLQGSAKFIRDLMTAIKGRACEF